MGNRIACKLWAITVTAVTACAFSLAAAGIAYADAQEVPPAPTGKVAASAPATGVPAPDCAPDIEVDDPVSEGASVQSAGADAPAAPEAQVGVGEQAAGGTDAALASAGYEGQSEQASLPAPDASQPGGAPAGETESEQDPVEADDVDADLSEAVQEHGGDSRVEAAQSAQEASEVPATAHAVSAVQTAGGAATSAKSSAFAAKEPSKKSSTGKGALAEGSYYFMSRLGTGNVVDVADGSAKNGANVQLYHINATKAQRWELVLASDGYAIIRSCATGKVLTVAGGKAKNGQNVALYQLDNSRAQKWLPLKQSGWLVLKSALAGDYVLTVAGGKARNKANLQIGKRTNSKSQLFRAFDVRPVRATAGSRVAQNGVYTIRPTLSQTRVLEVEGASKKAGANVRIATDLATKSGELFRLAWDGAGFYTITSVKSGMQLAPKSMCSVPGVNVKQYKLGSNDLAKWKIVKNQQGSYSFINKATSLALDVLGGTDAENQNVHVYGANGSAAQKYVLESVSSLTPGIYQIVPMVNFGLRAQLDASNAKAGVGFKSKGKSLNMAQSFRVARVAGGFTIQPLVSGLYLTLDAKGKLTQQKARKNYSGQVWTGQAATGNLVLVNRSVSKARKQAVVLEDRS